MIYYIYLREEWKQNNITKYQKYFDEWINNLTETQLYYYNYLWLNHSKF
jgi:hypothetical protein